MSRRHQEESVGFESDSFLDIIANIVGILIILIVLAGVRVSQAPVVVVENANTPVGQVLPDEMTSSKIEPEISITEVNSKLRQAQLDIRVLPKDVAPEIIAESSELLSQKAEITQAIVTLENVKKKQQDELAATISEQQYSRQKLNQLEQQLQKQQQGTQAQLQKLNELQSFLKREKMVLEGVQASWDEASKQKANVQQIKHQLTPIGRVVKGEEIHFHLKGNRIAHVPVQKLIERVKPQIRRQQQWLMKYNRYQGEVGPVEGFTMKYILERHRMSVIEELRNGRGMMRIGVTGWKIVPEKDLAAETATQALQIDSEFIFALQQAPLDATLTMWVYPDSFPLYREIQKFAQREGYRIAARPLPKGVNIAGSPSGSKSVGQ